MTDAQRNFLDAVDALRCAATDLDIEASGRDWRALEDKVADVALATRRMRNAFEDLE